MITAIQLPPDVKDPRLMAVVKADDGKRYLIFDPTDERTPVGNLPSYEQGGYGLLATGPSSQIVELPVLDPSANGTGATGKFTLDADGTLTGSVDTSHFGPEGADLRIILKFTDDKERRDGWEKVVCARCARRGARFLPVCRARLAEQAAGISLQGHGASVRAHRRAAAAGAAAGSVFDGAAL